MRNMGFMMEKSSPIYSMSKDEVLYQLLRKEHGYYKSIFEITQTEHQKLQSSNHPAGEMQPLQKKKRILLSCIHEIETAMLPLKKYWQAKTDRSDYISAQIQEELVGLNILLKEILQLDLVNQKIFESHLAILRNKVEMEEKIQSKPEKG